MMQFTMNGRLWRVVRTDPMNPELIDRTGTQRVATTNPVNGMIFLSRALQGEFLRTVLIHELGHAAMISYGLLQEIHGMTKPEYWVEMEETICNVLADYGTEILNITENYLSETR